jgi:hypothetical protein
MKKALLIASAVAATSLFAVNSNEISFLPVTPPAANGLTLLAVPFNGYGSDNSASIAVADVLLTDGLSNGDKLYIPTTTKGVYNQYTLNDGTWVPNKVVTITGSSKIAGVADSPTEATIARGQAFWLETSASSVKLLGQAATQAKTTVSAVEGYQLLAPTTSENDILISSLAGEKGDMVILANGARYQKTETRGWRNLANRSEAITDADKIPAGVGFWYKAAGARSLTL